MGVYLELMTRSLIVAAVVAALGFVGAMYVAIVVTDRVLGAFP